MFKDPPEVSSKCDIWSLGCIMYELIALRGPFEDSTWAALAKNISEKEPKALPEYISKDLCNLIFVMIDKDPSKRPSAKEILLIISEKFKNFEEEKRPLSEEK